MPNYPYHLARLHGSIKRHIYRLLLGLKTHPCSARLNLPWKIYSFCGEAGIPEQVASIRSFLRNCGAPDFFTVVSDGSITALSKQRLKRIHDSINVVELDEVVENGGPHVQKVDINNHVLFKKLALLMSISESDRTIYTDSDILFFSEFGGLFNSICDPMTIASYLLDSHIALDERMLDGAVERRNPVNSGFIIFNSKLDWSFGLERLSRAVAAPKFHTEQTVVHLCMHANNASQLPPEKCVNACDDQFIYRDKYASLPIALRHYTSPVRHKFWMQVALFR